MPLPTATATSTACFVIVLFLVNAMGSTAVAELVCRPPTIQNPCNSTDVDQSGATGALLPNHALNPIDLYSGNKYLREVDLYATPSAPSLEIVRHYNSMDSHYGSLGGAWRLSYDVRLQPPILHHANGHQRHLSPAQGRLETQANRQIWHYPNGDQWHFNTAGWLIALHRQGQPPLRITRHRNGALHHQIKQVEQNQKKLHFHYSQSTKQPTLQRISSSAGVFSYQFDSTKSSTLQRLRRVSYPDHRRLHYNYEPQYQHNHPWALTAKLIQHSPTSPKHRVRSWVYDRQGRAIFVIPEQPHNWVRVHYPNAQHPSQTQLHSSQGVTKVNFAAPHNRTITAVSGARCWACPPPFQRKPDGVQFEQFAVKHAPHNSSQIQTITGNFTGWPQLRLQYNAQGQLNTWRNAYQHTTQLLYKNNQAHRLLFANGDEQQVHYNAQQQVKQIDYQNQKQHSQTTLQRLSPRHLRINHPNEIETQQHNAAGQITHRHIKRRINTPSGQIQWHYKEQFDYDEEENERLLRHQLPEGGALHYEWHSNGTLRAIYWEDRTGEKQRVIQKIKNDNEHGYEYSNGLQQLSQSQKNKHRLLVHNPKTKQLWWQQQLQRSPTSGLVISKTQDFPILLSPSAQHYPSKTHYVYNQHKQLVIEKSHHTQQSQFYAWEKGGVLAAHNQPSLPMVQRDKSGLPKRWQHQGNNYMLRYNPMRQLDVVYNSDKTVQKNSYNAAGFRVYTQHYPQAIQQFFLYDKKRIVAEFSADLFAKLNNHAPHKVSRRYIYWHNQPIGLIDYSKNPDGELLVMHSDHLGAVHLISDAEKKVRWAAFYDTFGKATQLAGNDNFSFHLRREGQYYDSSTGWHYNLLRTYLPEQGQYLEPDPLGPNPTTEVFGYARQQPLNHTDPWGLLLFAFDGTRYDHTSGGVIHTLHQVAEDQSHYIRGPGNPDSLDWDAAIAHKTHVLLQEQWNNLLRSLRQAQTQQPDDIIPIDIIGFSRGSAIALHFANQLLQHTQNGLFDYTDSYGQHVQACIQPRFMGHLDNVAQMGVLGSNNHRYDFSVSPAWQWVVHGAAMHERRFLFPLYSLGEGENIQEVGFIGAHGDLGGGYPMIDEDNYKPLSDVALQWLLWQARAYNVQFSEPELKQDSNYAYLHDEASRVRADRSLQNSSALFFQRQHPIYGEAAQKEVEPFIDRKLSKEEKINSRVGKVDLDAYYNWLEETINWRPE